MKSENVLIFVSFLDGTMSVGKRDHRFLKTVTPIVASCHLSDNADSPCDRSQ